MIKENLPMNDYLKHISFSSSIVREMGMPEVARYKYLNPTPMTEDQRIGSILHAYILEPIRCAENLKLLPTRARSSKKDRGFWAEWYSTHGADGEEIIKNPAAQWNIMFTEQTGIMVTDQEGMEDIKEMAGAIERNKEAMKLLEATKPEISLFWKDEQTSLDLKARPDGLGAAIIDIKTTKSTDERSIVNDIYRYGYHIQQAMYVDGATTTGDNYYFPPFFFVFVTKKKPFMSAVYRLNDESQDLAHSQYKHYLNRLKECIDRYGMNDHWPGLQNNLNLSLPRYAFYEQDNNVLSYGV